MDLAHIETSRPLDGDSAAGPSKCALGPPLPNIPEGVHDRMESLAAQGAVPMTTPEQRELSGGMRAGSEYRVPDSLLEALRWGYVGPDLPAPQGFLWRGRAGKWQLAPRGG